jgi:hypothetical protein
MSAFLGHGNCLSTRLVEASVSLLHYDSYMKEMLSSSLVLAVETNICVCVGLTWLARTSLSVHLWRFSKTYASSADGEVKEILVVIRIVIAKGLFNLERTRQNIFYLSEPVLKESSLSVVTVWSYVSD